MSGYVDHAWRHRPKAEGGTDPLAVSSAIVPLASKSRVWAHTVGTGTGFDIDDLADFNGNYITNDPDETYFSDFSDSTLGYSREGIEIHHQGVYLFDWGTLLSFGSTGGPLNVKVYPNRTTGDLSDALSSFRLGWNTTYEYLTTSAAYGATQTLHLGGCATYLMGDATPTRFPLRIESSGGTADWVISTIGYKVSRLGDLGTVA